MRYQPAGSPALDQVCNFGERKVMGIFQKGDQVQVSYLTRVIVDDGSESVAVVHPRHLDSGESNLGAYVHRDQVTLVKAANDPFTDLVGTFRRYPIRENARASDEVSAWVKTGPSEWTRFDRNRDTDKSPAHDVAMRCTEVISYDEAIDIVRGGEDA